MEAPRERSSGKTRTGLTIFLAIYRFIQYFIPSLTFLNIFLALIALSFIGYGVAAITESKEAVDVGIVAFIVGGGIGLYLCYRYIWFTAKNKHRNAVGWILITLLIPFFMAPIASLILSRLKPLPKTAKDYIKGAF